jgi:hypothetical protein
MEGIAAAGVSGVIESKTSGVHARQFLFNTTSGAKGTTRAGNFSQLASRKSLNNHKKIESRCDTDCWQNDKNS